MQADQTIRLGGCCWHAAALVRGGGWGLVLLHGALSMVVESQSCFCELYESSYNGLSLLTEVYRVFSIVRVTFLL